jgi:hypothetical protein
MTTAPSPPPVDAFDFAAGADEHGHRGARAHRSDRRWPRRHRDPSSARSAPPTGGWRWPTATATAPSPRRATFEGGGGRSRPICWPATSTPTGTATSSRGRPRRSCCYRAAAGGYQAPVVIFDASGDGYELGYAELTGDAHFDLVAPGVERVALRARAGRRRLRGAGAQRSAALPHADRRGDRRLRLRPGARAAAHRASRPGLLPLTIVDRAGDADGGLRSRKLLAHAATDVEVVDLDADGLDDVVIGNPHPRHSPCCASNPDALSGDRSARTPWHASGRQGRGIVLRARSAIG